MQSEKDLAVNKPLYLIIPAAGRGTRMRDVSPGVPKELLPMGGRPVIQYAVEEGLSAGIKNIIIIINRQKEPVRRYVEKYRGSTSISECSFTFLYQEELLGEADAIGYAKDIAGNHPVAVMYPDNIYVPAPGALKRLVGVYEKYNMDVIALNEVTKEISHALGNAGRIDVSHVEDDMYRIEKLYQKTQGNFIPRAEGELRACGIYISGPFIFDYIERARALVKEGEFTDIYVRNLILKEKGILGCRLPGTVFDVGNPEGYRLCVDMINRTKAYR